MSEPYSSFTTCWLCRRVILIWPQVDVRVCCHSVSALWPSVTAGTPNYQLLREWTDGWTSSWWCIWVAACLTRFCLFLKSFTTFILILIVLWQKSQRITLTHEWIQTFTWEREEPAVHGPSYGLQLDHIHGLSYVHRGRHAAQGAAHKLGHLLHRKHLQQLIKDGWERVQKCSLRMKLGTEEVLMTRGERFI